MVDCHDCSASEHSTIQCSKSHRVFEESRHRENSPRSQAFTQNRLNSIQKEKNLFLHLMLRP